MMKEYILQGGHFRLKTKGDSKTYFYQSGRLLRRERGKDKRFYSFADCLVHDDSLVIEFVTKTVIFGQKIFTPNKVIIPINTFRKSQSINNLDEALKDN